MDMDVPAVPQPLSGFVGREREKPPWCPLFKMMQPDF